jgi:alpha,alpha-trehalose phosphorylase
VHPQADEFTEHEVWDFENTEPDQYPLLLHFPYFDLYRKQVVKQADLVLALLFCGDAFTDEEKARNFAYYERLTVRDSSLSAGIQAAVAAEVGHLELAYDYMTEAALMDLDDLEHNTRDGVHIASLAGSWIAAVIGFGGVREHSGRLSFRPQLPESLTRMAFNMYYQGRRTKIEVVHGEATYTLIEGEPLEVEHHGERITITGERPLVRPIPDPPAVEPPKQPPGRAPERRRPLR